MHAGEEDHARPGWTTSIRGQDYPWKSQSEWQKTEINRESTSMVWPTLGGSDRGRLKNIKSSYGPTLKLRLGRSPQVWRHYGHASQNLWLYPHLRNHGITDGDRTCTYAPVGVYGTIFSSGWQSNTFEDSSTSMAARRCCLIRTRNISHEPQVPLRGNSAYILGSILSRWTFEPF